MACYLTQGSPLWSPSQRITRPKEELGTQDSTRGKMAIACLSTILEVTTVNSFLSQLNLTTICDGRNPLPGYRLMAVIVHALFMVAHELRWYI